MLTIKIEKTPNELIVSFEAATRNDCKKSIIFNLAKQSEVTNDNIANFLTNLCSELLADEDDFKFDFQVNTDEANEQIEFVKQLMETFIRNFQTEYTSKQKEVNQKITKLKNQIEIN
ncbi:MAG: hypothetical protein LBD63_01180 [Mycoplasmataceae bacterium]|jgi:hypothetical protein|nr:hypothetical protein [Mycoplasmataceae bacterium]